MPKPPPPDRSFLQDSKRASTGVHGLDEIILGGFPRNRLFLVQGPPGVGKTTLALQFLLQGAAAGESVLYITLSETREEMEMVGESHGWDLSKITLFELSVLMDKGGKDSQSTFYSPAEVELSRTVQVIVDEITRVKPSRIVFDSLSELRLLAETPLRFRRQILELKQFFAGEKITVLLLDDCTSGQDDLQIESIAHGVINLSRSFPEYGSSRRRLTVQKLRASSFREGSHDYILQKGGMVVFPRLVAAEHAGITDDRIISSGNVELDKLLGGGIDRGTSSILIGPAGSGKSSLVIMFMLQRAQAGEKSLYLIFDENIPTLITRSRGLGMDLEPHIKSGMVTVKQIDPAELTPGELTHQIRNAVEIDNVRFVAIDSINGYMHAMPAESFLNLQLHELLTFLAYKRVITMLVLAQHGIIGSMQSSVDLTYLADTVILFRFFEAQGAIRKAISVIKKRTGGHERAIREISITSSGIEVGQPLDKMHGVLTGVPYFNIKGDRTEHATEGELLQ